MTKYRKICLGIVVISTIFLLQIYSEAINRILHIDPNDTPFYWLMIAQMIKYIIPVLVVLFIFHSPKQILVELGMKKGFVKGLQYGFLFTLPMLIGYFLLGKFNADQSVLENICRAFKDGFREEIFYRAFLFGQLFRQVKLGFLPAVFINAFIFGFMHLYQAHSMADSIGIFCITSMGAIWFAWLYIEWQENLWLPIFMHFFMNLYWHVFSTEQSALGGIALNLPRVITIALSIYITIKTAKKHGGIKINRENLVMH
jgi:uncharacterized protein